MKSVVVYCGSKTGHNPLYAEMAKVVGELFASRGITLVYGGGSIGLMGVISDTVMAKGGKVIGVITNHIQQREIGNEKITELVMVPTMHQRKQIMNDRSEAGIILPGALGTLDEYFEHVTWSQLELQNKPCGILNVNGFYDYMIAHIEWLINEGFLDAKHRELIIIDTEPEALLIKLERWIQRRTAAKPTGT